MYNLLALTLEAHNPDWNHHRRYQVVVGRDLLDDWTLAIRYGRTDQAGHEERFASPEPEDLRAVIRERLRRRLSAPKWIGCSYRLRAFSAAPGLDALSWLPGEVMARFFSQGAK
jgi:hypothetical protein